MPNALGVFLSFLMAEKGTSLWEPGEVSTGLKLKEPGNTPSQKSSVALGSPEELGESSSGNGESVVSNCEVIRTDDLHHRSLSTKASESVSYSGGTVLGSVEDFRLGGSRDNQEHDLKENAETLQVDHNELVPSASLDKLDKLKVSGQRVPVSRAASAERGDESGSNLFQTSSVALRNLQEHGEPSSGKDNRKGELGVSSCEEIRSDDLQHRSLFSNTSEDVSLSEDTRSVSMEDVRIGGCGNRDNHEQHSKENEETFQVYHNTLVPSVSLGKHNKLEKVSGQGVERSVLRAASGERDDSNVLVSRFLFKQLRNLAAKERDLEYRLDQERIEHVVEKVEGEVEFEQAINEMWLTMRADDEAQEMERKEREFEMERREVQLQDEVKILQGKLCRLEDELRLSHAEKEFALQRKHDEMDQIIESMLGDMRESGEAVPDSLADGSSSVTNDSELVLATSNRRTAASSQKAIFLAFEDMLKEADERAKQDRHVIESTLQAKEHLKNVFQQEEQRWLEKERHLESGLLAMEKEVNRISSVLREVELAFSVEQERRKEACLEVDQVLETWKEEKRIRGEYEEKVKRLLSFLMSMKEKLTTGEDSEEDVRSRLASVTKNLDKELQKMSSKRFSTKRSKLLESEQSCRWKSQRDVALGERDNLEEKLNLHLRRARDREFEIESMWMERERDTATKCSHLESTIVHWETKYKQRNSEWMQERKALEMELEAHRKQWADEKTGWEAFVLQREQWLAEQVTKWTSLLDAKDVELTSLKKQLEELDSSFKDVKQVLENQSQQVLNQQKQMLENSSHTITSCESYKAGRSSEEGEGESCQSIENFVHEIDTTEDVGDAELDTGADDLVKLRLGKEELEEELSSTMKLMDELRTEFQNKVAQLDAEKKRLEAEVSSKTAELEDLAGQLNARERQMESLMQKFRDEVSNIDREVEKERKEREEVMEMHFGAKRRLVAEIREKEESWQNELEAMTQELLDSREWARQKDEDIVILKEDLQALEQQKKAEEQRLSKRIHSLMKEKDVLTAALGREQKAREIAETECARLEGEHALLLEELTSEGHRKSRELESQDNDFQVAEDRIAYLEKQLEETMTAMERLRDELETKERQLAQAKMDKEAEWKRRQAALVQEHEELLEMREQEWMRKEQEILSANDKILAAQREEAAVLQGTLKEVEWLIKHGDMDIKAKLAEISNKEGMVQVHTSHLEEVDQYVLDLQTKLEESEKKRKNAEIAASVLELKRVASLDVQGDRDGRSLSNVVRHDGHLASHHSSENGSESLSTRTRSSPAHRSGRSSFSSIREIQPDTHWEVENSSSAGRHGGNMSSSHWHGQPRDEYLSSPPPSSPGRRQQKWLVDAAWLENVRKEQSFLRQQIEIERQRVYSLSQVETENRFIEAAIVRAMEEKHESKSKLLDLQQQVTLLQKLLAARSETSETSKA